MTIRKLKNELKKVNFNLDKNSLENLWNWFEFWYREDRKKELINEIVDCGKCICGDSEWAINHEAQGGGKHHLVCEGCKKECDKGEERTNEYRFESKNYGAYTFRGGVDKWYCETCKFELLCRDCGSPHELDTNLYGGKGEYEDFYICDTCEIERYEAEHEEKHNWKPSLECDYCENFVNSWNEKQKDLELKKV